MNVEMTVSVLEMIPERNPALFLRFLLCIASVVSVAAYGTGKTAFLMLYLE